MDTKLGSGGSGAVDVDVDGAAAVAVLLGVCIWFRGMTFPLLISSLR